MRKLTTIVLLLVLVTPCLEAQRKEMSQARSYIKSGKDFDKAETLLTGLLKDSANRCNPKIYTLLYQAQKKQYEQGNQKLYLKQKYDTATLFNITKRMFETLAALDSIDAQPDKKGKVNTKYRKGNAEELDKYRPNLFFGGTYYVRNKKYDTAFSFFDTYICSADWPMFASYNYATNDTCKISAAYWATFCGHSLSKPTLTLKYAQLALADTAKMEKTLRYIAEANAAAKDTVSYVTTLCNGLKRYKSSPYFFTKLFDYYTTQGKLKAALALADTALTVDGNSELFLYAKSSVLLALGRNDECIAISDSLIAVNDTLPEAYYNAANACINKAITLEEKGNATKKNKKAIVALYRQALPYMERYRQLAPNETRKWAPALYSIYLNLNMGKQFDEIDKLLGEKQ